MKVKDVFKYKVSKKCLSNLNNSKTNICKDCKNKKTCESLMEYEINKQLGTEVYCGQ